MFWAPVVVAFFVLSFWSVTMMGRVMAGRTTIHPLFALAAPFAPWALVAVAVWAPDAALNSFGITVCVFALMEGTALTAPPKPLT